MHRPGSGFTRIGTAIAALAICASAPVLQAEEGEIVVFRGATLIDGNGGPVVAHAAVVVQGDRLLFAGP